MTPVEIVGWAAALVGTVLGLPQLIRLVRTRNVEGLSLPAWQLVLALNIAWTSHGILLGKWNMILPNVFGLGATLPILFLMSRELGRALPRVMLPGILIAAGMIAVDLAFGTAAYGVVAIWPALFANAGQTLELVRSPRVTGVSPVFLISGVLNQVLWLAWGILVPDAGTQITATVTLAVTTLNLLWWILRKLGLRSFGVPTRTEVRAQIAARRAEAKQRREAPTRR
nr:PQ-loop domain-containing transporter [Propionicimonas sp.]